jgi:hypothetical protein
MRTKILSAAAAAFVLGIASSQAQVYSANVVGYYNTPLPAGQYTLVGNQLVNGTSNDLDTVLASLPNKSSVQIWNGSSFTGSSKSAAGWTPDQNLSVGQGFWVETPTAVTNTFVGSVIVGPGGSVSNTLAGGVYSLVSSPIPYAADLNDTNNTLNLSTLPNKTSIQIWNGSSFTGSSKSAAGWTPDQNLSVGQGFWVEPPSSGATWVQTLPSN